MRRSVGTYLALAKCSFSYMSASTAIVNSSSLLVAEDSQGTSNVLAHDLDLSELSRSTLSDLSNTQLDVNWSVLFKYLRKLLLVLLNLVHELITVLLTKFNSLNSGYNIRNTSSYLSTHSTILVALFVGARRNQPLG